MIKDITLTKGQASALSIQLYRYYDVDTDVLQHASDYGDGEYLIFGEVETGIMEYFVKMRIIDDTVEDLYLNVGCEYIEPTTTKEEQELR